MCYNEKTAAKLFNALISSVDDTREALKHAWIDGKGKMCACDGFRAYRLNVPVAGVPDIDAARAIDLDRIFPSMTDYKPLELPALADVRAMIDEDRRREKRENIQASFMYTFGTAENGEQLPAVNLRYLADALQLFPDARAYYKNAVNPIMFLDENGEALVLPVRVAPGSAIDATKRRTPPAPKKKDTAPAVGLRVFSALYA